MTLHVDRALVYRRRTVGEVADSQFGWLLGDVLQGDIGLPFPYHEVYDDKGFEHNGPSGVAQSVLQGSKYLCDASVSGVSCNKDMLHIF